MAEVDIAHFLTCPVCLDTLKEPVTLGCLHNFCCGCVLSFWEQSTTKNCPVCRRKSSKELLIINFALKELSTNFRQKQEATTQKDPETPPVCSRHPEVPPLFCKDKGRALCPVCEFSEHQRHTVVRVEEVQEELKEQMRTDLETLTKHRGRYKRLEQFYKDITQHTDTQAQQCESHIKAVFTHLHQLMYHEETRALEELREETHRQAHTMSPELGRIREELASMETTIKELKELLLKDTVLHSRPQHHLPTTPALAPGLLLDQAKVLGNLGFRVWRRLRREVSYSPVLLDINTAGPYLCVSEDLRGVRCGDTDQQVPVTPERFTKYSTVLGSKGFISGTHEWDVEVGDHPRWVIGVAKESVDRRGEIYVTLEHGIWCLWHGEGRYTNSCNKTVKVQKPPVKIRVKLDCDKGKVSFYDADNMTLLYTHKKKLTERMFPYFEVGQAGEAETKEIRIYPTEGSL